VLDDEADAFARALGAAVARPDTVTLPADATVISATVVSPGDEPPTAAFEAAAWVADADGSLARVPLVGLDPAGTRIGALPTGVLPWRLVSLEAERAGPADPGHPTLEISNIATDRGPLDTGPFALSVATSASTVRTLVGRAIDGRAQDELPVVVTTALAARLGLTVGDPFSLDYVPTSGDYAAVVAAVVDRIPGSASRLAVAADLDTLGALSLATGRLPVLASGVWFSTSESDAVGAAIPLLAPSDVSVATAASTSSAPIVEASLSTFWIAAVTAALLALIALAAFLSDDARSRRDELGVLRALGVSPREQGAVRGREQAVAVGWAAVVGTVGGLIATLVTVTPFAAAAVPGAVALVRITPVVDPLPWLVFAALLLAGVALIVAASLLRVRRSAAVAVARDERGS
jgi:hypothetical protein